MQKKNSKLTLLCSSIVAPICKGLLSLTLVGVMKTSTR